jgi:hypothetical protein
MSQTTISGAQASRWGLRCGRALAALLGASNPQGNSNECKLNGQKVVIKCAHINTDSVGVSYRMLERLDAVIGAFEVADSEFEIWQLSPEVYRTKMTGTKSQGPSAGKVGIVKRSVFQEYGTSLGRLVAKVDV